MEPVGKGQKKESGFKKWFNRLFCIAEDDEIQQVEIKRPQRMSKIKSKHKISMSLLGSYKNSILCKISRKNFIVNSDELNNEKLPSAISKYLGEKISSPTVVVKGEISNKVTRKIPYILKVISHGEKAFGQCIQGDISSLKLRINDLCIYKPKFSSSQPSLLEQDQRISTQITNVAKQYRNSVIILPKNIVLDEIGLILCNVQKFIQVETIVANALTLCVIVYIGSKGFVLISQHQQLQFVVKQLKKDLFQDDQNISLLVQKIYQRSSIADILFLLRKSISQAYVDTILSCFVRNALFRQYITQQQICRFFPKKTSDLQMQNTPSIRLTARWNHATSQNFKHTCSDDLLNGQNGQLMFQNQVQTFEDTQISMRGLQIMTHYNL